MSGTPLEPPRPPYAGTPSAEGGWGPQGRVWATPPPGEKLKLPAIFLMIIGGVGVLFMLVRAAIFMLIGGAISMSTNNSDEQLIGIAIGTGGAVLSVPFVLICGAIVYGGWQMLRQESYTWALVAAILAITPCTGCFPIPAIIGIWAVIVLQEPGVKPSFRS